MPAAKLSTGAMPESQPAEAPSPHPPAAGTRPADGHPQEPAAAPEVTVALTGTVGSGASAVATFRVGEETVFARPQEIVAGWRVARIQLGEVWLSHRNVHRLVPVGNSIQSFRK